MSLDWQVSFYIYAIFNCNVRLSIMSTPLVVGRKYTDFFFLPHNVHLTLNNFPSVSMPICSHVTAKVTVNILLLKTQRLPEAFPAVCHLRVIS
jgi:hypothetical protein